jgi:hypothetical protein
LLFGVTEDDIAVLSDDEFDEVWAALGKVARARSRVKKLAISSAPSSNGRDVVPEDEDDL